MKLQTSHATTIVMAKRVDIQGEPGVTNTVACRCGCLAVLVAIGLVVSGCDRPREANLESAITPESNAAPKFPKRYETAGGSEFIQLVDKKDIFFISETNAVQVRGRHKSPIQLTTSNLNEVFNHAALVRPEVLILIDVHIRGELGEFIFPDSLRVLTVHNLTADQSEVPIEVLVHDAVHLEKLIISRTELSVSSLESIASLPKLTRLEIHECPGIDISDIEALEAKLPELSVMF